MTRFAEKLDGLRETLELVTAADLSKLAKALNASLHLPATAVGSGGSAIVAGYLGRCRETLLAASTRSITPLGLTTGAGDLAGQSVWLLSAGADNSDFRAGLRTAINRRAASIDILTRRPGAAEEFSGSASVHVVPVATEKDGYLATHSLVASVAALLLACDQVSPDPVGSLGQALQEVMARELGAAARGEAAERFAGMRSTDTLLILHDPQLEPMAELIETSAWEAALCPVQVTDFRNFAHGRHAWLHHRAESTFVLALIGHDTEDLWAGIDARLPAAVRRTGMHLGDCGRFQNAVGIARALVVGEAIGLAAGIDPAKPGIADFGRALYADDGLERLAASLPPAVRHKRDAQFVHGDPAEHAGIHIAGNALSQRLSEAAIGGIILDYDGTIVPTHDREAPPAPEIVDEFVRLHDLGLRFALATGRGGSAGERLRKVLPERMHADFLIGYYNGGYLQPLVINIDDFPARFHPAVVEAATWLAARPDLFRTGFKGAGSRVQITIQLADLVDWATFEREVENCPPLQNGDLRSVRSAHSVDLIPKESTKLNVARRVADELATDVVILRVGDKGGCGGNDHELLSDPYGISVDEVCGRHGGCWSLFGADLTGPDALLRLLRALAPDAGGTIRIGSEAIRLDQDEKVST